MRDVYKDEEIGFANRFEQEAKANGPTQKEKDLGRALDEMAKRVYKEQCKVKEARHEAEEAYQKGHDAAVVESAEVIRHLNSQVTGLMGRNTILGKELAKKDEIIAIKDQEKSAALRQLADSLINEIEAKYISKEQHNKEMEAVEDFAYSVLEENYRKDAKIKDLEKRLHLVNILADTEKDLPKGIK